MATIISLEKRREWQEKKNFLRSCPEEKVKVSWWRCFAGKKFYFRPAVRSEAIPVIGSWGEDPPIMRFSEGTFQYFSPDFGGVFVGFPINDPTDLGECHFFISESELKALFRGSEKK